jgi:hypothetical protein
VAPDRLTVDLLPEQMVLLGLGEYAHLNNDIGHEADVRQATELTPLPVTWRPAGKADLSAQIGPLEPGRSLVVVAQAKETSAKGAFESPERWFGEKAARHTGAGELPPHEELTITATADGKTIPPSTQAPAVPVFSGIPWVSRVYDHPPRCTVNVRQSFQPDALHRIEVIAYDAGWA